MQNLTLPETGKTYRAPSGLVLFVEDVQAVPDGNGGTLDYYIEACPPDARNDISAAGYAFMLDEWNAHGFIPYE
jgi:hypothetical protein